MDDLVRFRSGELSPDEVVQVGQHLATCKECAAAARRSQSALAVAGGLRAALPDEPANARRSGRRWTLAAALAAAGVIGVVSVTLYRKPPVAHEGPATVHRPPPMARLDYGRSDWNELVNQALASGQVAVPDLSDLAAAGGTLRSGEGAVQRVDPEGVVVESDRPLLSWPAVPQARTYEVVVFRGEREILRSGPLTATKYIPERALDRGAVYHWQVVVTKRDGAMLILPPPPASPALIRILSADNAADLDAARRRFPNDALLAGTLEARFGLLDEARRDLIVAAKQHPGDPSVARLRDALAVRR